MGRDPNQFTNPKPVLFSRDYMKIIAQITITVV